jgi:2-C-methyl-D-erythritol 4-phosphate cytidylyltransferase
MPSNCSMRVVALVPAGGQGARLGTPVPKQFLALAGRQILERSVAALAACERISTIVVALPDGYVATPPPYLQQAGSRVIVVSGGARRQDSVARAFAAAPVDADIFVVHDAARPFVERAIIERTIDAACAAGAAVAALPASDTVKLAGTTETSWVGSEFGEPMPAVAPKPVPVVKRTLPRHAVYLAQTPQAFRREVLERALARAAAGSEATDEATLAEQAGATVLLVPGDARNIKITSAADLAFARGLLLERGELT